MQTIEDGILTYLGIGLEELKPESWSRAPRTDVMPDRFVLIGFTDGIKLERPFPNAVPNPLVLGPNPQNLESELAQQGGDLVVGEDYAWISGISTKPLNRVWRCACRCRSLCQRGFRPSHGSGDAGFFRSCGS